MSATGTHWDAHARQWRWIGPPLRPAAEDVRIAEDALGRWHEETGRADPRALLLGVTPEIVAMGWPAGTRLTAVDHAYAMIRSVWAGAPLGYPAICATWQRLPLAGGSHDAVLGDGCFTCLVGRRAFEAAIAAVRDVLRADGIFVMRFFTRPDRAEAPARVVDDLRAGRIGSFHAFKWRLAMALHGGLDEGVRLADVWEAWRDAVPDPAALAARLGWPLPALLTIDAYRGVQSRYTFPTLAETRALLAACFSERACHVPRYELGERCPTLVLRPSRPAR